MAYQQMTMMQTPQTSSGSEDYRGMSDEEELRRAGLSVAGSAPIGEVFVDTEADARDLGLLG